MQCPDCNSQNSPKAKFCAECGSPLSLPCPHCSFRNARDAADCGGCGRSLSAAQPAAAERRQITVFFSDIVGSTALAEGLDPEDLRDLYARYQAVCAAIVERYKGHLAQYLGDGVLAYFGYPAAHEDSAARAVRAGLDILDRVQSKNGDLPQVRIGIHSGLVVVGDVGAGSRREQLALGEAPNIAARLQSEALPDSIVISDATNRLVAGQFALEDLGTRTLKGLSRPIEIFRVLGTSGAASRFHAMEAARGLTPLVGRKREVEIIRAAWEEAAAGHGSTLLLLGEAGIGKSRLLQAAKEAALARQHEMFEAQCSSYQVNNPLFPIVEMLELQMGIGKETTVGSRLDLIERWAVGRTGNVEKAAAALADLLSVPATGRFSEIQVPPARRRQWLTETVAELFLHSAGGSPILLLIEDLHWADPSTLDLLGEIVARQTNLPVLLVGTARPEFAVPWRQQSNYREIHVESLSSNDTRSLVTRVAGPKRLPLAVQEEVVARTAGIPLFVEAVTRSVIEAGVLRELEDGYELTGPLPPTLIPATVQDSLMARIDRLGPDRPVAQLAATIGRESSFELLQAVLGESTDALSAALRHLVELDLVSENGRPPQATYTFKHALIQDAAYESLLRKTRQDFHARIAEVLIHRFPEMAEIKPELLARHFEGAGRMSEAIAGWMKAGQLAQQRSAVRECAAYLYKAISLLQTLPADDAGRLHSEMEAQLALSSALMAGLGWGAHEVEVACIRARELCEQVGNNTGLQAARWGLWSVYFLRGAMGQALEAAKPVLETALTSGDPGSQIAARQAVGFSTYFLGRFAEAREHALQGLALYQPDLERALGTAYQMPLSFVSGNFLALSLFFMGYPDQAEQAERQALRTLEALNLPACTVCGLSCSMIYYYMRRNVAEIAQTSERVYSLALDEGYLFWMGWARVYRSWGHAMSGSPEAAADEIAAGIESICQSGSGLGLTQGFLMMGEVLWRAGRLGEALEALSKGLKRVEEYQEVIPEPDLYRVRGEIQIEQGEIAAGEASLRQAIETAQAQRAKMLELRASLALARLQRDHGRTKEARDLLYPLHDWFKEGFDTPELCEARVMLAILNLSTPQPA